MMINKVCLAVAGLLAATAFLIGCDAKPAVQVEFAASSLTTPDGKFATPTERDDKLARAAQILTKRLAGSGLEKPKVKVSGDDLVVSAASGSRAEIVDLANGGQLEFRPVLSTSPVNATASGLDAGLRQATPDTTPEEMAKRARQLKCDDTATHVRDNPNELLVACAQDGQWVYSLGVAIIDGSHVSRAYAQQGERTWTVTVGFEDEAQARWSDYTASHVGSRVGIVLDSVVISAPVLRGPIHSDTEIDGGAGGFTQAQARKLAADLTSGALPVRLIAKG
ncbi:hypothetical protein HUN08_04480 [Gordonia sp. X0973]|uniref:SecDF P1 head subdomain-containing protein n=1 Tax=Gordonia sp. X0973 TaxID=2742602 RepID=UPI000F527007|nr:hypothetical protein [Gordonia sp. X0973]QKT06527.1 hypothetical protein HUN08_04480 [Gordonia sp. X0973]